MSIIDEEFGPSQIAQVAFGYSKAENFMPRAPTEDDSRTSYTVDDIITEAVLNITEEDDNTSIVSKLARNLFEAQILNEEQEAGSALGSAAKSLHRLIAAVLAPRFFMTVARGAVRFLWTGTKTALRALTRFIVGPVLRFVGGFILRTPLGLAITGGAALSYLLYRAFFKREGLKGYFDKDGKFISQEGGYVDPYEAEEIRRRGGYSYGSGDAGSTDDSGIPKTSRTYEGYVGEDGTSIASTISRGESTVGTADPYGVYNSPNGRGSYSPGTGIDYSNLTVGDLQKLQKDRKVFAFGKYQVVPSTLKAQIKKLGLKSTDKMDKATQDKIFQSLLDGRAGKYIRGGSQSLEAAKKAVAMEWAAVGVRSGTTGYRGATLAENQSYYSGVGGNKASISHQSIGKKLENARAAYLELIKAGEKPETAFSRAVLGTNSSTKKKQISNIPDSTFSVDASGNITYNPLSIPKTPNTDNTKNSKVPYSEVGALRKNNTEQQVFQYKGRLVYAN